MSRLLVLRSSEPVRARGLFHRVAGFVPQAALVDAVPAGDDAPAAPGKTVSHDQGFYIDGEPLIQRGKSEELSAYRATANLRTDQLMSVIGEPPLQQGVFRYRQFLCAVVGQLQPTAARAHHTADLPVSLRDNLRGRSEAELFFLGLLGNLHDADPAYLTTAELSAEAAVAVLAKMLRQAVPDEAGTGVVAALSHGDMLVIARRGQSSLHYQVTSEGQTPAQGQKVTLAVAEVGSTPVFGEPNAVPDGKALVLAARGSRPMLITLA